MTSEKPSDNKSDAFATATNAIHMSKGVLWAVLAAAAMVVASLAANAYRTTDGNSSNVERVDKGYALVQLKGLPLATYVRTKPAKGKKIDFSSTAVKSYRALLSAQRKDFKAWLRVNAPSAIVSGEYDISLNAVAVQLRSETLAKLASAPMVHRAEYQGLYYPTGHDPDLSIIQADQAWALGGGAANAGAGVKVAIVDTGIDSTHPCFDDTGYPAANQLGSLQFTNNKVIAAKVFNNKAGSRGYTPEAVQGHGTHVAGTVGCNLHTPATVDGVVIPYDISGVAPRALLGNYNVFPGEVGNARSEDILNALDTAYADGFDVANMSLGGGISGLQDLLTVAVNNLDQANMVVAVAAGNSGPGHFTIESPGSAARALTAGASTVPHLIGAPLTVSGSTYLVSSGDFATVDADLTAPLGVVTGTIGGLGDACAALPAGSLAGEIGLLSRGTCTFSVKIRNARDAGAVAVIVVNNVAGDPIVMGQDGTPNQPTAVPAYMVGIDARSALAASDGASATIGATLAYFLTDNVDLMAGFSSQGPTDVGFRVKPDVVAPGVNVLSALPANACDEPPCFAFFQGTSMATPHLAGSAAVVRQQHPGWSAAEVRSAIVNTADQGVLRHFQTGLLENDVNVIGTGRENLLSAVHAAAAIDPVSLSFGAVSSAGQVKNLPVIVTNLRAAPQNFVLSLGPAGGTGVTYSVEPAVLSLAGGESGVAVVTLTADRGAGSGDHAAKLNVSASGLEVAHAVVYTFIK
jgi:minor extracellular serine protease Vpr